jgi:hypothetical protein
MFNVYKNQQSRQTGSRNPMGSKTLPFVDFYTLLAYICICTFFVAFFSATINDRNLIFGHKLHIGTPYLGKRFLTRQIPTSCLPKSSGSRQTGSRNLTGPKTLPTIWHTYMKLVTKYQIPVINRS